MSIATPPLAQGLLADMVPWQETQGKQVKWQKKSRAFENFAKTQGILCAQVVNSLILGISLITLN